MKGHGELCTCPQCRPMLYPQARRTVVDSYINYQKATELVKEALVHLERALANATKGEEKELREAQTSLKLMMIELGKKIGS